MSPSPPRFPVLGWIGLLAWMAGWPAVLQAQLPNTLRYSLYAPETVPQEFEKQGTSVALDSDIAVVGVPFFDSGVGLTPDSGAIKIYRVSTGELLHLLENPNASAFAYFGQSVAISGSIVAVGSGATVEGASYAGRVDVFDLSSPTPTVPVHSIANPSPQERDQFGHSLALDGDRLVVGAWLDDSAAPDAGVAYVYDLGSVAPQDPELVLPNPSPAEDDCFGVAVAVEGDHVVISAYQDDAAATNSGRAYVFDLGAPEPAEPSMVLARPGAAVNDGFGNSLAISGDKVVVGIETADPDGANSGSAMVFDLSSATPDVPLVTLINPVPAVGCYFGTSVSISGDIVVVGAYRDSAVAGNGGACHVYDLAGSGPELPTHTLRKATSSSGDFFGTSVAVSGSKILAGASHDDMGDDEAGNSFLFDLSSVTPTVPVSTFTSPVRGSRDRFGAAVAISGDWVAIGSPDSDGGSSGSGRVSIHDLASSGPDQAVVSLENPDPAAGDGFGGAVAISASRVAVGVSGDDSGAVDGGMVYVYDLISGTPGQPSGAIPNPAPAESDGFGAAVAISGNYLIVGAGNDDEGAADSGQAYLFDLAGPTPDLPSAVLANPSPAAGDRFGTSVSISGNLVVVGAPGDDSMVADGGMAYVFDLAGTMLHTLALPSPAAGDSFGSAVAVSGGRVAVGAPGSDAGATDAGNAAVFLVTGPSPTIPEQLIGNPAPAAGDRFGSSIAASGPRVVVGTKDADGPLDSGRVYSFNMTSPTPLVPSASLAKPVPISGDLFGSSVGVDGVIIVVGTPSDNKTAADKGAVYVFGPDAPEIAIKGPLGDELHHGAAADFGAVAMGAGGSESMVFTVLNTGITGLALDQVSVVGGDAGDFTVSTTGMTSPVPAGDDTTFTVTLNPSVPGVRSTVLRIANSDDNEDPFDIQLTGLSLSPDHDTDGDGLNDVAELRMEALGFDWQVPNESLVAVFNATANQAGLFSPQQVRTLRIPPPLLAKGPGAGEMTLTLWLEKSAGATAYEPLPLTPADTSINPQGEMEFLFSVPDDTGFFRLETK